MKFHRFLNLFHQLIKRLRRQGLGAVAEGLFRIIVNLDHQAVGAGRDGCEGERLHHEADAGRVARVNDDGEMGLLL